MYVRYVRSMASVGGYFHRQVNPTRTTGIRSVSVNSNEFTGPRFQLSGHLKGNKKTAHRYCFPCIVGTTV